MRMRTKVQADGRVPSPRAAFVCRGGRRAAGRARASRNISADPRPNSELNPTPSQTMGASVSRTRNREIRHLIYLRRRPLAPGGSICRDKPVRPAVCARVHNAVPLMHAPRRRWHSCRQFFIYICVRQPTPTLASSGVQCSKKTSMHSRLSADANYRYVTIPINCISIECIPRLRIRKGRKFRGPCACRTQAMVARARLRPPAHGPRRSSPRAPEVCGRGQKCEVSCDAHGTTGLRLLRRLLHELVAEPAAD
ncbi:hypothetical protein EVAR_41304_1 [Eumeta japonica]|uniref:Uncharacterized protein n=1 Tax=Eumeta variegata TaxID=151549 RepID=A0A4C1X157_EUMVA|nr:hypothetical protein EVAR_41304_1 [Eumeta japonica]